MNTINKIMLFIITEEREIFNSLKKHLVPILIQESQTPNPPAQKIADLGVTLTLASDNSDFTHLFTHFVTSDNVNVK
jgi:hypothetical protein